MSWKRKKSRESTESLTLEYEDDRRKFFRVEPSPGEPVYFRTQEGVFVVLDISAGGLSLKVGRPPSSRRMPGELLLPGADEPVVATLEVLDQRPGEAVRGRFADMRPEERERIHIYVLERQKQQILAKRKRPLIESGEE